MTMCSICELEAKAYSAYAEFGYSTCTIHSKILVARKLINLHKEQGEEHLNMSIVADYVKQQETRYYSGEISKHALLKYTAAVESLIQIYQSGKHIHTRRMPVSEIPDTFNHILSKMFGDEERNINGRNRQYYQTRSFFRWLSDKGHSDLSCADEYVVRDYISYCAGRMINSSLGEVRRALKNLLIFVSEDGVLPEPMQRLFVTKIPVNKKIMPFMPADEIAAILNVIDRNTAKGKRDYAIILLAALTGLRGCDIAGLRLDSIDWRTGEIRIFQDKTEKALALPLTADVARAIRSYILNARPCNVSK